MNHLDLLLFGLICTLLGTTLFLAIQAWTRSPPHFNPYLGIFYSAALVTYLDDLLITLNAWKSYPSLMNVYIPVMFLLAPSYYLYIKSLTTKNRETSSKQIIHLSGFIVGIILCLPYYLLDSEIKLTRLSAPQGSLEHLGYITIAPTVALFIIIPFSLFYLLLSLKLIHSHVNHIKQLFSNILNKDLSWIRWSIIVLFIALTISFLQLFDILDIGTERVQSIYYAAAEICWLTVIGVLSIKQQSIFTTNDATKPTEKYCRSKIDISESKEITKKLQEAMQHEKLYQNPELTLRQLSEHLDYSENKISQVLNGNMGVGFYDYINQWRITRACELITQGEKNLLRISIEVGFNSRSTFNNAFKKNTGKTPSHYRKELHM